MAAARKLKVMDGPDEIVKAPVIRKTTPKPTKAEVGARAREAKIRRYAAGFTGGVGVGMLGLSVYHCTEAIQALAPSYLALSALLAVGIDAGMVASEVGELIAHDNPNVQKWARRYMGVSVALSMGLNAFANYGHATTNVQACFGVALGVIVPGLVFMLGKVAMYLAK
jgi:hypothetical protein